MIKLIKGAKSFRREAAEKQKTISALTQIQNVIKKYYQQTNSASVPRKS